MPSPPADADGGRRRRFDRSDRLRSRQQFDRVFASGRKVVTRHVVARLRPLLPGERTRVGLSVGRKVGDAPARNRVKRCLRAAWREVRHDLPAPMEVVLIARPRSAPRTTAEALDSLRRVVARAGEDPGGSRDTRDRRGPRRGRSPR